MVSIHQLVLDHLPIKRKQSSKGWINFNSPCCHYRGHNKDTRGRGNLLISPEGNIIVNCYNCGYKASYKDNIISSKFENYLYYLGIPRDKIQKIKLEILHDKLNGTERQTFAKINIDPTPSFTPIDLPAGSCHIPYNSTNPNYLKCLNYLESRGRAVRDGYSYFWCNNKENQLFSRIGIPLLFKGNIVGWTARYAGSPHKSIAKYFNGVKPVNYLFNTDVMSRYNRKFIIIVEGPFDAIAISGVGVLGKQINSVQINWLNSQNKDIIVLPDREGDNQDLIDIALTNGWDVSFPEWDPKIKDAADASRLYGKLWTVHSTIKARTSNKLEIGIKRKLLRG